jgi:hypothetical protein
VSTKKDQPGPGRRDIQLREKVLKRFLVAHRIGGLFYHSQLANYMARAGFQVRQVEKEDNHADVWVLKMWRWMVPAGREIQWAKNRVCLFLKRHGVRYPKKEVVVMVQGQRLLIAFNWSEGKPGELLFQKAKAQVRK